MSVQPQSSVQAPAPAEGAQRRNSLRLAWVLAGVVVSIFVVTLCTLRPN